MDLNMSTFHPEILVTGSKIDACVITHPGDIYTIESGTILRRYTFSDTRKVTNAGSISFKAQIHSFVAYPEINLILAHVDRAIHAVNTETMTSLEITSIQNVVALVPHCCGYDPVYVRFPDTTHTELIDLSLRSLYYTPISTNPAFLQRAISHSKRPCLPDGQYGVFDFIVMQEGSEHSINTSMSLIVCKSKAPVSAFPLPVSSIKYQTSTPSFLDRKVNMARRNINPFEFSYSVDDRLSRLNIMLLDVGKTFNSYSWVGEYLYFAHKDMINKKLKISGMDIRKLLFLINFTHQVHNVTHLSPSSLDLVGVPKEENLKYIGELVLTTIVEAPLTDTMTSNFPLFSLEKPTFVDSTLKKQLLHEVYLRLCAGEKMDRNFCNSYSSGTTMYSYGWSNEGHATHEAMRVDATEKGKAIEKIVKRLNLSFFDDRDMHNRVSKGVPSENSLRDHSIASTSPLSKVESKDTCSGNTTIKAISHHPRLCFNLLRDANNIGKDASVFSGQIIDPKNKGKPVQNRNVITSKGPELFCCVQALSRDSRDGFLRCPTNLLESDLIHLSESMAKAVHDALQFSKEDVDIHTSSTELEVVEKLDQEFANQLRKNKYCGAYIPVPYILRVRLDEKNKPYTYIDTEKCVEESDPSVWNHYNILYGQEADHTIIGMNKLYRFCMNSEDLFSNPKKYLAMQRIVSSEESLDLWKDFVEEPIEPIFNLWPGNSPITNQKQIIKDIIPASITGNTHIFGLTNMYFKNANSLPCDTSLFYIHTNTSLIVIKRTSLYRQVRANLLGIKQEACTEQKVNELLEYTEKKLENTLVDKFDMSSRDWTLCWVLTGSLRLLQKNFWGAVLAFINARMVNPLHIVGIFLYGISLEYFSLIKNTPAREHQLLQSYLEDANLGCYSQRVQQVLSSTQYDQTADQDGRVRYSKDQSIFHGNSLMDDLCKTMTVLGISGEQDYVDLPPELELISLSNQLNISCMPVTDEDITSRMDACLLYLKLILDPHNSWNLILHGVLNKADNIHEETKNALVGKISIFSSYFNEGKNVLGRDIIKPDAPTMLSSKSIRGSSEPSEPLAKTYRVSKPTSIGLHNIFPLRILFIMLLSRETYHISRSQQRLFLYLKPTKPINDEVCFLLPTQYNNIFFSTIGLLTLGRFYDLAYIILETCIGWSIYKATGISNILGREWSLWAKIGTGEHRKAAIESTKTTNAISFQQIYPGLATDASIETLNDTYRTITVEQADLSILQEYTKASIAVLSLSYMHITKYAMLLLYKTITFFTLVLKNTLQSNLLCGSLSSLSMESPEYCANVLALKEQTSENDLLNAMLEVQTGKNGTIISTKKLQKEAIKRIVSTISICALQQYLLKTEVKRNPSYISVLLQVIVFGARYALELKSSMPSVIRNTALTYISSDATVFLMQHIDMLSVKTLTKTSEVETIKALTAELKYLSATCSDFDGPYLLACIKLNEVTTAINTLYEKAFPGISAIIIPLLEAEKIKDALKNVQPVSKRDSCPNLNREFFNKLVLWCVTASHSLCMTASIMQDPAYISGNAKFDELWNSKRVQDGAHILVKEDCLAFLMNRMETSSSNDSLPSNSGGSPAALLYEVLYRLKICNTNGLIRKADFSYCLMSLLMDSKTGGCGPQFYVAKYLYNDVLNVVPDDYPLNFLLPFLTRCLKYQVTEEAEIQINFMSVNTKLAKCNDEVDRYKKTRIEVSSFTKCGKCKGLVDPGNATKLAFKRIDGSLQCFHTDCVN